MQKQQRKCDVLMEENYGELLIEIAKILQKKYTHMSEISRLTNEMAEELSRDDRVSVQMTLGMRGEELEKVRECDHKLHLFINSVPPDLREWLTDVLKGKGSSSEEYGKEGSLVTRVAVNIRNVWEKTMTIDRHMNKRLAGADSFYTDR